MDNEKLVFVDADFSIEKFAMDDTRDVSGTGNKDPWETDEY